MPPLNIYDTIEHVDLREKTTFELSRASITLFTGAGIGCAAKLTAVKAMLLTDLKTDLSKLNSEHRSTLAMAVVRKIAFHYILHFICYHKFVYKLNLDFILEHKFTNFLGLLLKKLGKEFYESEWSQQGFFEACQTITLEALDIYAPLYGIEDMKQFDENEAKTRYLKFVRRTVQFFETFINEVNEYIPNRQ
ncbi:hypothetical protein DAMA08_027000 [Martiniozyma asiatica (nom. inval.)]|nr:hypothetical protein DAMA08_027000 [Martiniozyma asiatica]